MLFNIKACEKAHFLLGNECIECTFPCNKYFFEL